MISFMSRSVAVNTREKKNQVGILYNLCKKHLILYNNIHICNFIILF